MNFFAGNVFSTLFLSEKLPPAATNYRQEKELTMGNPALGPHRPDAIWHRDENFQFSKVNKTEPEKKFCKNCKPTSNC